MGTGQRLTKWAVCILVWLLAALVIVTAVGWFAFVPSAKEPPYVFVTAWGGKGAGPGQFHDPTGIAVAGGEVFVSDARNGRIQVFNRGGRLLRAFGKPGGGPGELGRPMNLSVRDGVLYVPEYMNDRVQVFGLDGTPLRTIGRAGQEPGAFNAPGGVAVGKGGALLVADFYNHRIQKFGADGRVLRVWGAAKTAGRGFGFFTGLFEEARGAIRFSYPTDVAVRGDGTLFIADGYNDRVQVIGPDGRRVRKWGGPFAANIPGPFPGWFKTVTSIALGPRGNVFVVDFYNHRVQKFAPDGTFLTSFGRKGSRPGAFLYPIAVDVADDGTVYVADYGNNRVGVWRSPSQTAR